MSSLMRNVVEEILLRISDYFVNEFKKNGVKTVFGLSGSGTALQFFDALYEAEGIDYFCTLTEQAAGFAADAYASIKGGIGVCFVTSGPGVSNIYTCVAGSYYNSNPVVYIVGQCGTGEIRCSEKLRHYGYHENNNIINAFKDITKYVVQIEKPERARYELEKALFMAMNGRPGPVLISLPNDITWLDINPEELERFEIRDTSEEITDCLINEKIRRCADCLRKSRRPVLIVGRGVRCSGAIDEALVLARNYSIPVAPTWGMRDIMSDEDPLFTGSFGVQGSRSGNFAVQLADTVIVIGSRLDVSETGRDPSLFADKATVVHVDIDEAELLKSETYNIHTDIRICCSAKKFLNMLEEQLRTDKTCEDYDFEDWRGLILKWRNKYGSYYANKGDKHRINPYFFLDVISQKSDDNTIFVTDTSTSRNYFFQSYKFKGMQRALTWWNYSCLGYGLCGAIGTSLATDRSIITIMGDGAAHFNIQEFATIVHNNLNIKILVMDNHGYGNIYRLQDNYLGKRHPGSTPEDGLPLPNLIPIIKAYGLPCFEVNDPEEVDAGVEQWLNTKGPSVLIIETDIHFWTQPFKAGKGVLYDMIPPLPKLTIKTEIEAINVIDDIIDGVK